MGHVNFAFTKYKNCAGNVELLTNKTEANDLNNQDEDQKCCTNSFTCSETSLHTVSMPAFISPVTLRSKVTSTSVSPPPPPPLPAASSPGFLSSSSSGTSVLAETRQHNTQKNARPWSASVLSRCWYNNRQWPLFLMRILFRRMQRLGLGYCR